MTTLFSYIKEHLSILDVVNHYVRLRNAGTYWKGSCPFHSETDASFTVSPDKQIFYCFGCHAGGDVISFIAKIENMTQLEAAYHIIDQHNITVPDELLTNKITSTQDRETKERYLGICSVVSAWTHEQLLKNDEGLAYLANRNISTQTITSFQIGYFPGGGKALNSLIKYLQSLNFLVKDLLDFHIVLEGRGSYYSPFEERILFPISNAQGKICGFGGRIFKNGDDRPKYYNSKETDGFEKGKLLFGFDKAKKSMSDKGNAFLVEGYMDCIMMVQSGYTNTVATLGTACTLEHLKTIARTIDTLWVIYDGDKSGQQAMVRLAELSWEVNLDLKVIKLPKDHDPASFLSVHKTLDSLLASASDIMAFFIESQSAQFSIKSLAEKMAIAQKVVLLIAKVTNIFKQDLLLLALSSATQLPFQSLKDLLRSNSRMLPKAPAPSYQNSEQGRKEMVTESDGIAGNIALLEEKIFSVILNSMDLDYKCNVPVALKPYFSPQQQQILELLETIMQTNANLSLRHFLDMLSEPLKSWVIRVTMEHGKYADERDFNHLLDRFCKHHWKQIVQDAKEKIRQATQESCPLKLKESFDQFNALKKRMMNRGSL